MGCWPATEKLPGLSFAAGASPHIARECEDLAPAQIVQSTMQRRSPRNTFKQVLERTSGAGLVQYAG
jgi:hypothetical protein